MKALVFATVLMCMGETCEQHQIRIEERACALNTVNTQVPFNGEWQQGKIVIKCHK